MQYYNVKDDPGLERDLPARRSAANLFGARLPGSYNAMPGGLSHVHLGTTYVITCMFGTVCASR